MGLHLTPMGLHLTPMGLHLTPMGLHLTPMGPHLPRMAAADVLRAARLARSFLDEPTAPGRLAWLYPPTGSNW